MTVWITARWPFIWTLSSRRSDGLERGGGDVGRGAADVYDVADDAGYGRSGLDSDLV